MRHKLIPRDNAPDLYDRYPHEGDCTETLCPKCGCCTHCLKVGCGCSGCTDSFCECTVAVTLDGPGR